MADTSIDAGPRALIASASQAWSDISNWLRQLLKRPSAEVVVDVSPSAARQALQPSANSDAANPTIIREVVQQPIVERVIERIVERPTPQILSAHDAAVTEATLTERLNSVIADINGRIQNAFSAAARTAIVENLSDVTVDGVSGLTDADIPDSLTASNYLTLTGGTLSGNLTITGDFTVNGAQTLSGAITIPYLSATSTLASTFIQASTTRFSVFDTAYFGGTSTTTINNVGSITLPSAALLTAPYASSTALTITGNAYFPGTGIWNSSGNVGIGTTSPANKTVISLEDGGAISSNAAQLLINHTSNGGAYPYAGIRIDHHNSGAGNQGGSSIHFSNNLTDEGLIQFDADLGIPNNFRVENKTTTGPLTFGTNGGTERLRITSDGNVGIGQTSPTYNLDVTGLGHFTGLVDAANFVATSSSAVSIFNGGLLSLASSTIGGGTQTTGLTVSGGATTTGYFLAQNMTDSTTGFQIKDADGGTPIFNVDTTNERVGIGTTGPAAQLDVSSTSPVVRLTNSTDISPWSGGEAFGQLQFYTLDGSTPGARTVAGINAVQEGALNEPVVGLAFLTGQQGASATERARITNTGQVGIGTTSPYGLLSVEQGTENASLWIGNTGSSTPSLVVRGVNGNGHVGIGTANPGAKLDVQGTASTSLLYVNDGSAAAPSVTFASDTDTGMYRSSANVIGFSSAGTQILTMNASLIQPYYHVGRQIASAPLLQVTASSATTPGFTFWGDENTGLGWGAADELSLITGGSSRLYIDDSGNVGIGTTNPSSLLHVAGRIIGGATAAPSGNNTTAPLYLHTGANEGIRLHPGAAGNRTVFGDISDGTTRYAMISYDGANDLLDFDASEAGAGIIFRPAGTEQVRITNTGNVGIGDTSPDTTLHVTGAENATYGQLKLETTGNDTGISFFSPSAASADSRNWMAHTNYSTYGNLDILRSTSLTGNPSTVVASFDKNGNLGIGTTSPWRTLSVTGTVGFDGLTGSTGAGSICLDSNKQLVYNSGSDACLSSTRATKHDIIPLSFDTLSLVDALDPVSFVYNEGDGRVRYGFIAEDTALVDGHLATYNASGTISGIDDRAILSVVVKVIKDLWTAVQSYFIRTEALESEVESLKARLSELEARVGIPSTPPPASPEPELQDSEEAERAEEQETAAAPEASNESTDLEAIETPTDSTVNDPAAGDGEETEVAADPAGMDTPSIAPEEDDEIPDDYPIEIEPTSQVPVLDEADAPSMVTPDPDESAAATEAPEQIPESEPAELSPAGA